MRQRTHMPGSSKEPSRRRTPPRSPVDVEIPLSMQVLRRFRIVFNAVKAHFQNVEKRAGIGGAQLWALSLVQDFPGIGINDLARGMDIHQSTASNLVRGLVDRGLVAAARGAPDKRSVQLMTLPAGRRILRRAPAPFSGVLPDALASLDPKTLKRLDKDLANLLALIEADERAGNVPLWESYRPTDPRRRQ